MPRVLIVDDDKTTVDLLKMLLELDGFDVSISPTGKAAQGIANDSKPDAFLIDFNLPDATGTDIVSNLRKTDEFGSTPIIMASGMEREKEALAAGADFFLIKPFEPDDLVAALNRLLGGEPA